VSINKEGAAQPEEALGSAFKECMRGVLVPLPAEAAGEGSSPRLIGSLCI